MGGTAERRVRAQAGVRLEGLVRVRVRVRLRARARARVRVRVRVRARVRAERSSPYSHRPSARSP